MRAERRRALLAGGLALAALGGLVGWGGSSLRGRADFAFCNQNEISSLDPAASSGVPEARILTALFEGLFRADPATGEPLPGMASAWEVRDGGLSWRFTIREDSRWTNGDPVTARDFAWSFARLLAPETSAPYADMAFFLAGARQVNAGASPEQAGLGVAALDDHELELRLTAPMAHLPKLLALMPFLPVHRATVEAHGRDWIRPEHLVSNGPFRLVERRIRDRLRLVRHEGYWGAAEVALGSIDAWAVDGITTQLNLYLTGEVDWMIKPPTSLYGAILPRDDALSGPQAGMTFFRFNVTRPPFDDPRVRRALTLALDRQALARDVMRGGELPAGSFVPAGLPGYAPAALAPADPDLARRLLAEAGYPGGAGFPSFEILYPHNESTRDFCEAVAAQLRERLGLQPRLVNQAWKVFLDSSRQLRFDLAWGAWIGDYLDPAAFLEIFRAGSGNNRTGWVDAGYDALLDEAALELDASRRAALLARAEERLLAALPCAPVYQRINLNLVSPRVSGFFDNALDVHPLRDLSVTAPAPGTRR